MPTGMCKERGQAEVARTHLRVHVNPPSLTPGAGMTPFPVALLLFLSPLRRRAFEFLVVSVDAGRTGVQLHEELGEFVLRKHGLQEALQEHVHQPPVHGLVLEHVEDAEDPLSGGLCSNDVFQFI